jgi:altronate dehydratase
MSHARASIRGWNALAIHPDDNVAVALDDVASGAKVCVRAEGRVTELAASQPIALGHKIALVDLAPGDPIVKYGETIGVASATIAKGSHVHVHNLASRRGRQP